MLFLHETHEVIAGKTDVFEEALQTVWRPWIEERNEARLCWLWHHTHGTGPSYQAVSVTAVRDWATWGTLVERARTDPPADTRAFARGQAIKFAHANALSGRAAWDRVRVGKLGRKNLRDPLDNGSRS